MRRLKHLDRTTTAGLFDNNGAVQDERKSQYRVVVGEFWERRFPSTRGVSQFRSFVTLSPAAVNTHELHHLLLFGEHVAQRCSVRLRRKVPETRKRNLVMVRVVASGAEMNEHDARSSIRVMS